MIRYLKDYAAKLENIADQPGLTNILNELITSSSRGATKAVAASDSLDASKQAADYVCDGVDDQVQIQAAIDALPANGGKILLLEGTFLTSSYLLPKNNMWLDGFGASTIIKPTGAKGIHIDGKNNFLLSNFLIDNALDTAFGGVNIYSSSAFDVKNVKFQNTLVDALAIQESSHFNAEDCYFTATTGMWYSALRLAQDDYFVAKNNHLDTFTSMGIGCCSCRHGLIEGNVIKGSPAAYRGSIWIGSFYRDSYHINVFNNTLDATGKGIQLIGDKGDGFNLSHVKIAGNDIKVSDEGIGNYQMTQAPASTSVLTDIVLEDNILDGASTGIRLRQSGALNFDIEQNKLYNCATPINIDSGINVRRYKQYSDLLMDVLAVSATQVVNAQACHVDPTTLTVGAGIAAQPDVARTFSWVVNNAGGITAADIAITGIDAKGNSITESFNLTGGLTGETNNAFATVSEVKIENQADAAAGDTISVGITDVLGLSNIIYETGDVYKIKKNNGDAVVVAGDVDITYDTYDFHTIGLAATNDFTVWFKSNLNILS